MKNNKKNLIKASLAIIFLTLVLLLVFIFSNQSSQDKKIENQNSEDNSNNLNYDLTKLDNVKTLMTKEINVTNLTSGSIQKFSNDELIKFLDENFYDDSVSEVGESDFEKIADAVYEVPNYQFSVYTVIRTEKAIIIFVFDDNKSIAEVYYKLNDTNPNESEPEPSNQNPTPTPTVSVEPSIKIFINETESQVITWYTVNGAASYHTKVELVHQNVDLKTCKLTTKGTLDDDNLTQTSGTLPAIESQYVDVIDGSHEYTISCTNNGKPVSKTISFVIADRQPKKCKNFSFQESVVSVASRDELADGIIGKWEGCVSTPWTVDYYVSLEFKSDGTYSAKSDEVIDSTEMTAFYYGTDGDNSNKKFNINDLQSDMTGTGDLSIYFGDGSDSVVNDTFKNMKLMGNKLSFDFYHFNQYGPVTFKLNKVN